MAKEGAVTYEVRADDSKVESDLSEANKKVEKAVKKSADDTVKVEQDKTKKISAENDKVSKNAEKAAGDVADAWKDAGEDAKKAISDIKADDVTIDVDADTSNAESRIKSVSRDKSIDVDVNADTSDAEEAIKGLEDTARDTAEKTADIFDNLGGVIASSLGDAAGSIPLMGKVGDLAKGFTGTQAAAIGAGVAIAGVGTLAVGAANDSKSAINDFLASTGIAAEQTITNVSDGTETVIDNTEKYQSVLEDIYKNNYGDSFGDIGSAMSDVVKQMGILDETSLQNVTESAFALRDTFGYEIPESTRAAKAMMDNFGISGEDAMNLIASGAQNGLDYSGELLDSISEYSVQFGKMGLDAEDMFAIFQTGAESGAFNLDKVGDAVKEMSIRVVDGSDTTREGFELIGLNADEMAAKFAAGGETAKEAFNETIDAIAAMEDPLAQNQAGVDLMGTMWEDLGADAVTALADIQDSSYGTSEAMEQIKDVKYDDLGSQFEELKRNVETAIIPIGESLMPLLMDLGENVLPLVTDVLAPLLDLFSQLLSPIISLIGTALAPLIDIFILLINTAIQPLISVIQNFLVPIFTSALTGLAGTVKDVLGNITNIFRDIIDFIKNVFTANWKGAWENVKDIFKNIVEGLGSIFKAPLNFIIDGINGFIGGLNNIQIPDWVPAVGGKGFNIPKIPRLKVGMDYVPSDMFPAYLDKGEWVLTKEEADYLRSFGGLEGMADRLDRTSQDAISVMVQGGTQIDYKKIGDAVYYAFQRYGMGLSIDRREFGRIVEDVLGERGLL